VRALDFLRKRCFGGWYFSFKVTLGYRNLIIELRKSKPFCKVDADGFASARWREFTEVLRRYMEITHMFLGRSSM